MMKKWGKTFLVFFLVVFSFFLPKRIVFGQQAGQYLVCLDAKKERIAGGPGVGLHFNIHLKANPSFPPLPDTQTFILLCGGHSLTGFVSQFCTTGNPQADITIYGQDNTSPLMFGNPLFNNPVQSDSNGGIGEIIWSAPHRRVIVKFYALNYLNPTPTVAVTASPTVSSQGGLQQGQIIFGPSGQAAPVTEQDCQSINFDPYGRVFDSQSLEPIPDASVTLLMKRTDGNFTPVTTGDILGGVITNPQTTVEDGMFSFVVPDGTYKLSVAKTNYTFPVSDLSLVHPNYSKIYSDIYPVVTGEEIVQAGTIQHRDIPLVSTTTPTNNPAKLMEYFYQSQPTSQSLTVEGDVSHPFSHLLFYSVKPSSTDPTTNVRFRQLGEIQADKMGSFKFVVDQSTFEPTESFGEIEVIKVDLTQLAQGQKDNLKTNLLAKLSKKPSLLARVFFKKVSAQTTNTTTVKINPIPSYLEGYAYDSQNKVIPNAVVGIYLTFSSKPYYQTKADSTGYFKITSEYLPTMPYNLRYTTPTGQTITTTTSQFIIQNQDYLTKNKTNLYVYKNQTGKIIQPPSSTTLSPTTPLTTTAATAKNNLILILAILIFFLIAVTVFLAFYILRKKKTEVVS